VTEARRRRFRNRGRALLVSLLRLGALLLIVAAAFALVVLGIGDVPTSGQWTLLAFAASTAALVAIAYARLRPRITAWAESIVHEPERPANSVVQAFSTRVSAGLPVDDLLPVLVESLRSGLAVTAADVWTDSGGVLEPALADPPRIWAPIQLQAVETAALERAGVVGRSWLELWLPALLAERGDAHLRAAPMVHDGDLIGLLVIERETGRAAFSADDDETLALLARQAALAFRTVRLGSALDASLEELRASRARVVAAGDAERRRIERDLHDGAQQHLLGLAVNLRVARELVASDPTRADALLATLSDEVHSAIDELRDLAHGIYPPLLAERGLPDAVRSALAHSGVAGSVSADGLGRYPPEVEATVYFCCVEALQNAAKHSPAASVRVRMWTAAGTLLFEVRDDGPGFDPQLAAEGAGLTNMRDRVGALGGSLRVDADDGTCVTGALPLVSAVARPGTAAPPSPAR
jgi:signal transduction histidine kinase